MRKSPFCTKLTQVMDFKETETHCGQSPVMIHNTSNKGIWPKNISNSMHGIKSFKLAISKDIHTAFPFFFLSVLLSYYRRSPHFSFFESQEQLIMRSFLTYFFHAGKNQERKINLVKVLLNNY